MNNRVSHDGVVSKVEGRQVTVQFVQRSACADCHAKMLCTGGDTQQRHIVADSMGETYLVGEEVTVEVTNQLAWTAMFYAFGLPTLIALAVLFSSIGLVGEMWACLVTLLSLAAYYFVLYILRDKLDRKVVFVLHHKV
ncbi:MAG: SoxR reducing system RseC family protein [Bacteroidales bacterium]|nr:SoxR reducing system RseC family protein [Candidatus Liminaster caballi]